MTKEKLEKEIRQYLREQFNHVYEDDVPTATKVYLAKVKNNMVLLKGAEE